MITAVTVDRATHCNRDKMNGDNCGHSFDRLSQNCDKATCQNSDRNSLYIHGLNNVDYELLHNPCVCNDYYSVCDVFEKYDNTWLGEDISMPSPS